MSHTKANEMSQMANSSKKNNKRKPKKAKKEKQQLMPYLAIQQHQIFWVKLRGFRLWAAVIEGANGTNRFSVHFFGDYTTSVVFRSSIVHNFNDGFLIYENDSKSKNVGLNKAVKEASMMQISQKMTHQLPSSCCICNYLNKK